MADRTLRGLRRSELLELLLAQMKENEALRAQNSELQQQLDSRAIRIRNCGSIAEAALQLNNIFESAQIAAEQYLENIRQVDSDSLRVRTESANEGRAIIEAARVQAEELTMSAKAEAENILSSAESQASRARGDAPTDIESCISGLTAGLEAGGADPDDIRQLVLVIRAVQKGEA